ncbi:MAG: hypothetical protein WBW81_14650 [Methylocella sp.]
MTVLNYLFHAAAQCVSQKQDSAFSPIVYLGNRSVFDTALRSAYR